MKKKKGSISASEVIGMLEFLHSGVSWLPSGKESKTTVGSVEIIYNPKESMLEFRAPVSWVNVQVPSETVAKRLVSGINEKLAQAKDTNSILECLLPHCSDTSGIQVITFWGL